MDRYHIDLACIHDTLTPNRNNNASCGKKKLNLNNYFELTKLKERKIYFFFFLQLNILHKIEDFHSNSSDWIWCLPPPLLACDSLILPPIFANIVGVTSTRFVRIFFNIEK